jgi:hypothetical protein
MAIQPHPHGRLFALTDLSCPRPPSSGRPGSQLNGRLFSKTTVIFEWLVLRSSEVRISTKNQLQSWSWVKIGCFSLHQSFSIFLVLWSQLKYVIRDIDSNTFLVTFVFLGKTSPTICHLSSILYDPTENFFYSSDFFFFNSSTSKSGNRLFVYTTVCVGARIVLQLKWQICCAALFHVLSSRIQMPGTGNTKYSQASNLDSHMHRLTSHKYIQNEATTTTANGTPFSRRFGNERSGG